MTPKTGGLVMAGAVALMASAAPAARQVTCEQIVTVSRFAGGRMSTDDLARKFHVDVDIVRGCLAKDAGSTKAPRATRPPPR